MEMRVETTSTFFKSCRGCEVARNKALDEIEFRLEQSVENPNPPKNVKLAGARIECKADGKEKVPSSFEATIFFDQNMQGKTTGPIECPESKKAFGLFGAKRK